MFLTATLPYSNCSCVTLAWVLSLHAVDESLLSVRREQKDYHEQIEAQPQTRQRSSGGQQRASSASSSHSMFCGLRLCVFCCYTVFRQCALYTTDGDLMRRTSMDTLGW